MIGNKRAKMSETLVRLSKPKPYGFFRLLWRILKSPFSKSDSGELFFLKCDEKGCLHMAFYPYPHEDMIDEPCPSCGANLCSRQDMESWLSEQMDKDDPSR